MYVFTIVNTVPSLKDLCEYIIPHYAVHWKLIGTQLGLSGDALDIIEVDNIYKAVPCCNAMFSQWLELHSDASWKKVFSAIESPLMYTARALNKGDQSIHVILCLASYMLW